MTVNEEIEQLKSQLANTVDESEEAEILLQLVKKYAAINSVDSKSHIDRLLQLAEKLPSSVQHKAWGLYYLAHNHYLAGEYGASIALNQQALALFEELKDKQAAAGAYNNIGLNYTGQSKYPEALENYLKSLGIEEETGDKKGMAVSYSNIGLIHWHQGNYPDALKNNLRALHIFEEMGDKRGMSMSYNNIGMSYADQSNYPEALKNYLLALHLREEVGDKRLIASSYNNIGNLYHFQDNYMEALKIHLQALRLNEEISNKSGLTYAYTNIGNIHEKMGNYPEALKNYSLGLQISKEIGYQRGVAHIYHGLGKVNTGQSEYAEAVKNQLLAFKVSEEIGDKEIIKESAFSLSNNYKATGDFENALKYHEKYHAVEAETLGEQAQKQLNSLNFMHNLEQKEKQLEIEQLRNVELKRERDRSESLLLNILPVEVAEELKEKGTAGAKLFDDVTVLFTDFKGFTTVSERLSPQQLVDELHACFSAFDEITGKYNIEKIKTVGDAYLAVSGLPLANPNHAEDLVKAAIEIRDFIDARAKVKSENAFKVRIGVHSGSVVAGIVGVKKFAYDIWGDTVNTAARMEQNSEAGKINISQTTYGLVKDKFNCEYRGEIEAKNKGKLKMYFVEQSLV